MSTIFGPIRQLGVVVRDFDAAIHHWTAVLGIGPFFHFRNALVEDYHYRGEPAEAPELSIAFGYTGDLQIEIIQQHNDAPSCYLDFLSSGREGLQHVSGFEDRPGYERRYQAARDSGLFPVHEGAIGGVRFAYFDTIMNPTSPYCEISESDMAGPKELFESFRMAALNWDARDPLRPMPG